MKEEIRFTAADIFAHEQRTGVSVRVLSRALARRDPRVRAVAYRPSEPGANLPFELEVRLSNEAFDEGFSGPDSVEGMRVHVARTGDIVPLARTDVLKRPVRGGACIGAAPRGENGTFACRAFRDVGNTREYFVLSAAHVLDFNGTGSNPTVVQPGVAADLSFAGNEVARGIESVPVDYSATGSNRVDAAIAPALPGMITSGVMSVGAVRSWRRAVDVPVGLEVLKSGMVSPYVAKGLVSRLVVSFRFPLAGGEAWFDEAIITTRIAKRGDSGSLCMAVQDKSAIGIVMANDDDETYVCPIEYVQDALNVKVSDYVWPR